MYIDKTNEVMMNYYKKQEILKAKQRLDQERMPIVQVLQLADKEFITIDELLEALYIDKEEVFEEILNTQSVSENTTDVSANTANVSGDTPMEIAKTYKEYYEKYNHDRKQIRKDKKIANGTFQKYLRLNYLIPELQEMVNNKKLSVVSAEQISFLDKHNQENICYLMEHFRCEITESVAKKIKQNYLFCKKNNGMFFLNESVIKKYKKEKNIRASFTQDEIEKYFNGIPKHSLKEYIISIAKNIHDV
ncbi:putative uncharacterized protein [Clostridium sp. CAG:571]|nr:putative uncharacterized protein [Clostridium sp. CAG:571]